MTEFEKVTDTTTDELSVLASSIVKEHYDPILGPEQNDYMIDKFQSPNAIRQQIKSGYQYYFVLKDGKRAGFFGYYPKDGKTYLSKLYIQKDFRGNHLAKDSIRFIADQTIQSGMHNIFLNVNRYNAGSIAAYEKLGFRKIAIEDNPIGNGYYMNDYVMEKELIKK